MADGHTGDDIMRSYCSEVALNEGPRMAVICGRCLLSVEPIRIFEKSPRADKWWRITRCPKERCGFNLDIEACDKPGTSVKDHKDKEDKRRYFWNGVDWV